MKGFVPVKTKIAQLIGEWATRFVRLGRDSAWERAGTRDEEDIQNRIYHHCEYLNAHWDCTENGGFIKVHRGNGTLFAVTKDEGEALLDELERFLQSQLTVATMFMGQQMDKPYHIESEELDMDWMKEVVSYCQVQPRFKHFNPEREEVVIDVQKKDRTDIFRRG
jgi:hypothetical protein